MKVNTILLLIACAISLLLGYWVFTVIKGADNDAIMGIGSCVCFLATLIPAIGLRHEEKRLSVNLRVLSILFFVIVLIMQFVFANTKVSTNTYVITSGLVLLIYLAAFYALSKSKVS